MSEAPADLADLPDWLEFAAGEAAAFGNHLAVRAIDATLAGSSREAPYLRQFSLDYRLKLSRQQRRVVFWLWRRDDEPEVAIDAKLRMQLTAIPFVDTEHDGVDREVKQAAPKLEVELPGLIARGVTPARRSAAVALLVRAGDPAPNASNSLVVQLATGTLGVYRPRSGGDDSPTRLQLTQAQGGSTLLLDEDTEDLRLGAFLQLIDAIGRWVSGESETYLAPVGSGRRNAPGGPISDVEQTVASLVAAFAQVADALDRPEGRLAVTAQALPHPWLTQLATLFASRFDVDVGLRLDRHGQFATSNSDNPFQLAMRLSLAGTQLQPVLRLTLGIPDFLIQSTLQDRLRFTLVDDDRLVKRLADTLDAPRADVRRLLAASAPVFYRVQRVTRPGKRLDTDVCVFRGALKTQAVVVIVEALFRIRTTGRGAIRLRRSTILYAGGERPDALLPGTLTRYFARWTTLMLTWGRMVA